MGTIHGILGKNSSKSIGIRADMDALPLGKNSSNIPANIQERCMLVDMMAICDSPCGWKKLAKKGIFWALHLIFQPGERVVRGKAMIDDGLFEKHPCSEIYALHNWPGLPEGAFGFKSSGLGIK